MSVIVKEMSFEYEGGRIFGLMYTPENFTGKLPAVIMSHGYNSSHEDIDDIAMGIAEKGFGVYCFDFRGGSNRSKSSGSSLDMTICTEIADLKAVISMVSGLGYISEEKIFLYGESQGGFVSALTGSELEAGAVAGMVLIYPAFCIPDIHWTGRPDYPEVREFMGMKISRKLAEDKPAYDPFEKLKDFNAPVLIIHGDADTLVDISYSQRISGIFSDAELIVLEGEGHGFSAPAKMQTIEKTAQFLEKLC